MVNWTDTLYSEGCLLFYDRDKKMVVGLGDTMKIFRELWWFFKQEKSLT